MYEHTLLHHLHACGWPVATPLTDVLPTAAGMWCLFTYVSGRQRAPRASAGRYAEEVERGRLLANLHQDLAPLARLGQRDRWKTTPEGLYDREGKPSALSVLTEFARRDAERGRLLLAFYEQATEKLTNLPLGDAPLTPLHGDFTRWNMRYRGGKVTGVFDFDSSHLDLRVADFALSWRGIYGGVIDGYNDVSALSDLETALIVPVFQKFMISGAIIDLEEIRRPDWPLKQLRRQSLRPLP